MNQALMTSGQLARAAAVNVETLRFYERHGLLLEPERTASGHRRYGPDALERLQLIKRAQTLGFSLSEITTLLEALSDSEAVCEDVCAKVKEKIDHVDDLIHHLREQRQRLVRLRDACPQTLPLQDCPVVQELGAHVSQKPRDFR